jgi:hypothetical protein
MGYPDGTFKPDNTVTREEYAVLVAARALKYSAPTTQITYNDQGDTSDWAKDAVQAALDAGLMKLFDDDGTFRGHDKMVLNINNQLIPIISPPNASNKKVLWTSSKEEIALVDKTGHITGKSPGNTVVKAKTVDGNFSVTCNVYVNSPKIKGYVKVPDDNNSTFIPSENSNVYVKLRNLENEGNDIAGCGVNEDGSFILGGDIPDGDYMLWADANGS